MNPLVPLRDTTGELDSLVPIEVYELESISNRALNLSVIENSGSTKIPEGYVQAPAKAGDALKKALETPFRYTTDPVYEVSRETATRYKHAGLDFSYNRDMEREAWDKQGGGFWSTALGVAGDAVKVMTSGGSVFALPSEMWSSAGTGRAGVMWRKIKSDWAYNFSAQNQSEGEQIEYLTNAIFDPSKFSMEELNAMSISQDAIDKAHQDRISDFKDPRFRYYKDPKDAPFRSYEGLLGQAVESIGFTAGGVARGAFDYASGVLVKQGVTKGGVWGIIGGVALGVGGLAALRDNWRKNDTFREYANTYLSWLLRASLNGAMGGKITKGSNEGIKKIAEYIRGNNNVKKELFQTLVKGLTPPKPEDILASGWDTLKSGAAWLKGINTGMKLTTAGAYYWLSGGAEAALQATSKQLDYVEDEFLKIYESGKTLTEEDRVRILDESENVRNSVNTLNKVVLTFSNAFMMKGLLGNPLKNTFRSIASKHIESKLAEAVAGEAVTATAKFTAKNLNPWKTAAKLFGKSSFDAFREGLEEMSQFAIDEGVGDYYSTLLDDRSRAKSLGIALSTQGMFSEQAIHEGFIGFLIGGLTGGVGTIKSLAGNYTRKGGFGESLNKTYYGYNNSELKAVTEELEEKLVELKQLFTGNVGSLNLALKGTDVVLEKSEKDIHDAAFNFAFALHNMGFSGKLPDIIDHISNAYTNEEINSFLSGVDSLNGVDLTDATSEEKRAAFRNNLISINKDVEKVAKSIHDIGEYFDNPYDESFLDTITGNFVSKAILKKSEKGRNTLAERQKRKELREFTKDLAIISARSMFLSERNKESIVDLKTTIEEHAKEYKDSILNEVLATYENEESFRVLDYVTNFGLSAKGLLNEVTDAITKHKSLLKLNENETIEKGENEKLTKSIENLEKLKEKLETSLKGKKDDSISASNAMIKLIVEDIAAVIDKNASKEEQARVFGASVQKQTNLIIAIRKLSIANNALIAHDFINKSIKDPDLRKDYIEKLYELRKLHQKKEEVKAQTTTNPTSQVAIVIPRELAEYTVRNDGLYREDEKILEGTKLADTAVYNKIIQDLKNRIEALSSDNIVEIDDLTEKVNEIESKITTLKDKIETDVKVLESLKEEFIEDNQKLVDLEKERQKELEPIKEEELESIRRSSSGTIIIEGESSGAKVGDKFNEGLRVLVDNVLVDDSFDSTIAENNGEGYTIIERILTYGKMKNGKMSKAPVLILRLFNNKEDALAYNEKRDQELLSKVGKSRRSKKVNARYDALKEILLSTITTNQTKIAELETKIKEYQDLLADYNTQLADAETKLNSLASNDESDEILSLLEKLRIITTFVENKVKASKAEAVETLDDNLKKFEDILSSETLMLLQTLKKMGVDAEIECQ